MGLAHDKEMRNGCLVDEAVAQKTVMVQPNMPRFLREGDKSCIVVKLFNTSDKKVNGNARMQILDAETQKVVWQKTQGYRIDAEGSATISFDVQGLKEGVYINKVVAAGTGYSDGEQHYLPVLDNRELVVNTLPITLHQKGEQNFDLEQTLPEQGGQAGEGRRGCKGDRGIYQQSKLADGQGAACHQQSYRGGCTLLDGCHLCQHPQPPYPEDLERECQGHRRCFGLGIGF